MKQIMMIYKFLWIENRQRKIFEGGFQTLRSNKIRYFNVVITIVAN